RRGGLGRRGRGRGDQEGRGGCGGEGGGAHGPGHYAMAVGARESPDQVVSRLREPRRTRRIASQSVTRRRAVLGSKKVSAVLCSTDLERSREFYEQKLGLALSPETIKNHLLFECGEGTTLLVYGRPSPSVADHTQVRFWSDDVEADVREL